MRISPLSLHFHGVQFRSAGEKRAVPQETTQKVLFIKIKQDVTPDTQSSE